MKLGELFIELGVVGDTKELKKALKQMKKAEDIAKTRQKIEKQLGRSLKANEVNLIKNAYAMGNMVTTTIKVASAIGGAVLALDRMAQSMIKVNQSFIGFQQQTGMSINKANEFVSTLGLATGASKESVLGDLTTLSQRIYRLTQFGEGSSIFAQMGFSPRGMEAFDVIKKIREVGKLKGYTAQTYTTIADQLGISREWVQMWQMEDDLFNKIMKDSEGLQLSEEQRLKLYKLSYENRLAHAKIEKEILELEIKLLPIINVAETIFANILKLITKIPIRFTEIIGAAAFLASKLEWVDKLLAFIFTKLIPVNKMFVSIYKYISKIPLVGKMIAPFIKLLGIAGARILPIIGQLMLVWDIVKGIYEYLNGEPKGWFAKLLAWTAKKFGFETPEKAEDENVSSSTPAPVNMQQLMKETYNNVNSNMVNNFYNNPVPAGEVQNQLALIRDQNLGWV